MKPLNTILYFTTLDDFVLIKGFRVYKNIENEIKKYDGWSDNNGKLYKVFSFDSQAKCVDFIKMILDHCNNVQHHPILHYNSFYCIEINLYSHKFHAITELDFKLADDFNKIYSKI